MLPVGYVLCVLGAAAKLCRRRLKSRTRAMLASHRGMVTNAGAAATDAAAISAAQRSRHAGASVPELGVDLPWLRRPEPERTGE